MTSFPPGGFTRREGQSRVTSIQRNIYLFRETFIYLERDIIGVTFIYVETHFLIYLERIGGTFIYLELYDRCIDCNTICSEQKIQEKKYYKHFLKNQMCIELNDYIFSFQLVLARVVPLCTQQTFTLVCVQLQFSN